MNAIVPLLLVSVLQLLLIASSVVYIFFFIRDSVSRRFGVPFVPTPIAYAQTIHDALRLRSGDTLCDLGCGDGRLLFELSRMRPDVQFIGIEANPILLHKIRRTHMRLVSRHNLTFRREDLFNVPLEGATHIYTYLLPSAMERLYTQHANQTHIVRWASRAFPFKNIPAAELVRLSEKNGTHNEHLLHVYERPFTE